MTTFNVSSELRVGERADQQPVSRALATAMNDGFIYQDKDGAIIDYNEAACRILRMTPDQLLGKSSLDADWKAIREDGREFPGELHPIVLTLRSGEPCYGIIMGVRSQSDDTRWIQVNSEAVRDEVDGGLVGAIAVFTDITSQILMKKALSKTNTSPEAELMAARLQLQKLIFDFTGPGHSVAAHLAIIKKHLESEETPDYVAKCLRQLDEASEKLVHLLYEVSSDAPADDSAAAEGGDARTANA